MQETALSNAETATSLAVVHLRRAAESLEQFATVQDVALTALAQSTLALAQEQRTANLIAALASGFFSQGHSALHAQVRARLGLGLGQ